MSMNPIANVDWKALRLTPVRETDIDLLNEWQNTPEIRDLILGFRAPVQRQTTQDWLKALQSDNLKSRVFFAIRVNDEIKGAIHLFAINWVQRTASLGIYIGDSASRGGGLGAGASALILDYGFNGLDLARIGLEVLSENETAQRLYDRLGFKHEGTLRSAYNLNGQRRDVDIYGLLRSEWTMALPDEAQRP